MGTLIENKQRIISAFNSIRSSIYRKGQITTPYVDSYANAIRLIGIDSFIV